MCILMTDSHCVQRKPTQRCKGILFQSKKKRFIFILDNPHLGIECVKGDQEGNVGVDGTVHRSD